MRNEKGRYKGPIARGWLFCLFMGLYWTKREMVVTRWVNLRARLSNQWWVVPS